MTCIFEGVEYSEGSLVCANGRELVCRGDECMRMVKAVMLKVIQIMGVAMGMGSLCSMIS